MEPPSPSGAAAAYTGQVIGLQGSLIKARVTQSSGTPVDLDISLSIDQAGQTVSGTVRAQSAGAGSP